MREQGYSPSKIQSEVMKYLRADKEFQMALAENTKAYKEEVREIIKQTVAEAKKAGDALIAEAGDMSWNADMAMWAEHGVDLKKPNTMSQLKVAFAAQTANELKNITRSTGFKNVNTGTVGVLSAYQKELDLALLKVATGTFSYDQAVQDCVHRLAESGLRSIDYKSGRTFQLDTAVRNAIRTGCSQLAGKIMEENLKSTGQDLVITSQHMGSRPEHAPWQNKVFSYSGKSRKYADFFKETGYGTVTGLKGANCAHDFYPFWEGAWVIPEDIVEPDPVMINGKEYTYYQCTQKQRSMERDIRALKREINACEALGMDSKELRSKLKMKMSEYRKFSDSANLKPKMNRLRVVNISESRDIRRGAANSVNTGEKVYFDAEKNFKVDLENYSEKVRKSLSEASREVAKRGSETGFEYGVFVNLGTGEIGKYVTDELSDSVFPDYKYFKENPNVSVAFVHNHNQDTELSFPDVGLMVNQKQINVVAAVRNDGIITVVESNGSKDSSYLPYKYLQYRNQVESELRDSKGFVDPWKVEIRLRDELVKEYSKGGIKTYGE
jgi:hypothetical protein